jgi:hypothetical protein
MVMLADPASAPKRSYPWTLRTLAPAFSGTWMVQPTGLELTVLQVASYGVPFTLILVTLTA